MITDEKQKEISSNIDKFIEATNLPDDYSIGLKNGMRLAQAFMNDSEPQYEETAKHPWIIRKYFKWFNKQHK